MRWKYLRYTIKGRNRELWSGESIISRWLQEEHKEEGEDKLTILVDGGCENQRESTDGCSQLYVGDIEIRFENIASSQISHEHKYEDLVAVNEEPR